METLRLEKLRESLEGELRIDTLSKALYATDASVYRKTPLGVAFPKGTSDIKKLILFVLVRAYNVNKINHLRNY